MVREEAISILRMCKREAKENFAARRAEALDIAINALLQKSPPLEQMKKDMMYDIYMEGVNMSGEYHGCWVRFKDVENVVDRFFTEVLEDGKID